MREEYISQTTRLEMLETAVLELSKEVKKQAEISLEDVKEEMQQSMARTSKQVQEAIK